MLSCRNRARSVVSIAVLILELLPIQSTVEACSKTLYWVAREQRGMIIDKYYGSHTWSIISDHLVQIMSTLTVSRKLFLYLKSLGTYLWCITAKSVTGERDQFECRIIEQVHSFDWTWRWSPGLCGFISWSYPDCHEIGLQLNLGRDSIPPRPTMLFDKPTFTKRHIQQQT